MSVHRGVQMRLQCTYMLAYVRGPPVELCAYGWPPTGEAPAHHCLAGVPGARARAPFTAQVGLMRVPMSRPTTALAALQPCLAAPQPSSAPHWGMAMVQVGHGAALGRMATWIAYQTV